MKSHVIPRLRCGVEVDAKRATLKSLSEHDAREMSRTSHGALSLRDRVMKTLLPEDPRSICEVMKGGERSRLTLQPRGCSGLFTLGLQGCGFIRQLVF